MMHVKTCHTDIFIPRHARSPTTEKNTSQTFISKTMSRPNFCLPAKSLKQLIICVLVQEAARPQLCY